jgi:hypothetical protein
MGINIRPDYRLKSTHEGKEHYRADLKDSEELGTLINRKYKKLIEYFCFYTYMF